MWAPICEASVDGRVVLIDDARFFVGEDDCSTVDEVKEYVPSGKPNCGFELGCDIMRFAPSKSNRRRGDPS